MNAAAVGDTCARDRGKFGFSRFKRPLDQQVSVGFAFSKVLSAEIRTNARPGLCEQSLASHPRAAELPAFPSEGDQTEPGPGHAPGWSTPCLRDSCARGWSDGT